MNTLPSVARGATPTSTAPSTAPAAPVKTCSHSISARLSKKLAIFTMLVLGSLSWVCWMSVHDMIKDRHAQELEARAKLVGKLMALEVSQGGEQAVIARLQADAAMRPETMAMQVDNGLGTRLYTSDISARMANSEHIGQVSLTVPAPKAGGGELRLRYRMDYTEDARMGDRWAIALVLVTIAAGAVVAAGAYWHVQRQLKPLRNLASQTRAISPGHLDQRLALTDPAEELRPWIDQFNELMGRLERSYAQLEGFNADVAHELRTPLTTLIGQTEVALSRERSSEVLRETLVSNLEEMQRLAAMVNDMLFLSQADRGAVARRGARVSLKALAQEVCEFHEAPLDEARLALRIEGDAEVAVDEPLVKRALSNLVGNATRFAEPGSTVQVRIATAKSAPAAGAEVEIVVQNTGPSIDERSLPRLFDRFFRADTSRCRDDGQPHHGLGLAIVAAIARMHAGRTVAESHGGITRVGFTLAAQ